MLNGVLITALSLLVIQEPVPCGPSNENHRIIEHKGQRPTPSPTSGKAMVYVIRKEPWHWTTQAKLAMNGQWVAVLMRNQYTFFETDPGLLRLCLVGELGGRSEKGYLLLTAQAGQTYYLEVNGKGGSVAEMDAPKGRQRVTGSNYVTWEIKK